MNLATLFKKFKSEILLVILIFLASLLIRSYRISDYLFFGFEQGRDAFLIKDILSLKTLTLIGPSTSIGGVFHGPLYYYLMAIPYGLSGGNPLAAVFFLCLLGSFVPVVAFYFAKDFFNSSKLAFITAVFVAISFEYILYSRWLSNVSPSPLFIILAFYLLWLYIKFSKDKFFLGFVLFASIATQFEMILLPQFVFLSILLLLFRLIKFPKLKLVILSLSLLVFIFSPLILFDFRHQHISLNSLLDFSDSTAKNSENSLFREGLENFFIQSRTQIENSIINTKNTLLQLIFMLIIFFGLWIFLKNKKLKEALFLLSWIMMSLPLIVIGSGNPQNYVAIGLGWIFILSAGIWGVLKLKIRLLLIPFLILAALNLFEGFRDLDRNMDIFYVTTQVDLNLKDQVAILYLIHEDVRGKPYRFQAYTVPSLHPEGWEYLRQYYFPNEQSKDHKIYYIAIEKNVYPIWEKKWINDLGQTKFEWERKVGLLRIQKRTSI